MASKYSKSSVDFEHPAKGKNHCVECKHYVHDPQTCEIVVGHIEARDWCKLFARKSRMAESFK